MQQSKKVTNGTLLMAPITTEDSQIAKTPPAPYMITIGLFSTASHYKQQDCNVYKRFFSTNRRNKEIIRKLEKGGGWHDNASNKSKSNTNFELYDYLFL